MRKHEDARRIAYCDLFPTPGDVNVFYVRPGARTCWHRHQRQTDYFRVLRGQITFGVVNAEGRHSYHCLYQPDWAMKVEPNQWHGYQNTGPGTAILLMYLTQKYDPTDEERVGEDVIPWKGNDNWDE